MPFRRTHYRNHLNQTLLHSELYGQGARTTQLGTANFLDKVLDIMQLAFEDGMAEGGGQPVKSAAPAPAVRPDVPGVSASSPEGVEALAREALDSLNARSHSDEENG